MRATIITAFALLIAAGGLAKSQTANELAPNGTLRVGVLLSNPVLVTKMQDGKLSGVSVDLGRMIAAKLGARYQEVTYQTTETFGKSFGTADWDIAIGPRTPLAEKTVELSPPFMLVDNIYVAVSGHEFANASEVDRAGVRIAVVVNGAPDQFLSTTLKAASLVRVQGATPEIVDALKAGKADVYGSNAESVHAAAAALPGSKIVPGAFRSVSMVVAYPRGKSSAAQEMIKGLVSDAKSSGLVQKVIEAGGLKGVRVAN
jgi:polar amino acid transport system substrate-binding protein